MACRLTGLFLLLLTVFFSPGPGEAKIELSDDSGRTVRLSAPARRVVSLYAGHSENILALGAGGVLTAVSDGDDPSFFPGVVCLPARADAERILALAPDLVLLRPLTESVNEGVVRTLERSGVAVFSLSPPTWDTMESYLSRLGALLGILEPQRFWRETVEDLESRIPRGRKPVVFLESSARGMKTCSPSSWAAHMIVLAGGENGAAEAEPLRAGSPLASWGEERLLTLARKGIDVYLVQVGAMNPVTEAEVRSRPWISGLGEARIVCVPEELIGRPSLFRLKKGVERLSKLFFPEGGRTP